MMKFDQQYDAIILGGGVAGLGAAYAFVRRKKKVLILIPPRPLKGESTPASAGILDPFLESTTVNHPFFKFKKKAFLKLPRQLRALERESGLNTGYARTGMLFTARNFAEERKLKSRLASHKRTGIPVQWMDQKQVRRRWSFLSEAVRGGLYYPTLGRVFPARLQAALRRAIQRRGGQILEVKGTLALLAEKKKTVGVQIDHRKIRADNVINAGGSWADQACLSRLRFPIYPVRGQVLVLRGKTNKIKTVIHSSQGTYVVPWEDGSCLLGASVESVGFKPSVQQAMLKKIHREAAAMIPALDGLSPLKSWAGLRPCSVDHLPVLGKTVIKGYYMAGGYYRSGIVISLYAGELLAEGIFGKSFSKELMPYSPMRFE